MTFPAHDPGDLQTLCLDLLTASAEALDTIPDGFPDLLGAPDVQYVSPGQPAIDCCEQLTVHCAAVTESPTQPGGIQVSRRQIQGRINLVTLVVTIARCIPVQDRVGTPPDAAAQTRAAEQTNADAWALWNHLWNLLRADALFTFCGEVFWDGMRALSQNGGCGGWTLTLRASLDGYNEDEVS